MLQEVVDALKNDEIVCFPTETLYALACNAFSERAVCKLYDIKQRPYNRPFSLMLGDIAQLSEFSSITNIDLEIVKMLSPGPITYVFPLCLTQNLPRRFFKDTLGIRIPDHALARDILRKLEFPVAATSANISGGKSAARALDVPDAIRRNISKFWENDNSVSGVCSTVFDMINRKVLRAGMLPNAEIINAVKVVEKQHGYNSRTLCSKECS